MTHDRVSQTTTESDWLTLPETARRFGVSTYTVRRWIREGRIPAEKRYGRHGEQFFVPCHAIFPGAGSATSGAVRQQRRPSVDQVSAFEGTLVGRERELCDLRRVLDATREGRGRLTLVGGEAGIGKSTLVRALAEAAASGGWLVLTGNCYDLEVTPPYGPWMSFHDGSARVGGGQPPADLTLTPNWIEEMASPRDLHERIWAYFTNLSRQQPLLVVLEDMHWADQASVDVLRSVVRHLQDSRVAIVVTYRDRDLTPEQPLYRVLPHLVREGNAERMSLRRLDQSAVEALIRDRYDLDNSDLSRLAGYLNRYAQGNPFFAGELLHALESSTVLHPAHSGWVLEELPAFQVPPLIQQVLDGRLSRLPQSARDHLQVAAAIGEEVPVDLWLRVVDVSESEIIETIEAALDADILIEQIDRPAVRFRHALIRQTLYERMILLRRRHWHRRIAEVMDVSSSPDPDAVAYHFERAGDSRAAEWLIRAGDRASRSFAYLIAADRYQRALELASDSTLSTAQRVWLLCEIAVYYRFSEPLRGLTFLDDASQLMRRIDDPALTTLVLWCRTLILGYHGERTLGYLMDTVEAYEGLLPEQRDWLLSGGHLTGFGRGDIAFVLACHGSYDMAERLAQLQLADEGLQSMQVRHSVDAWAWCALALVAAARGEQKQAGDAFEQARAASLDLGDHFLTGSTVNWEIKEFALPYFSDDPGRRQVLLDQSVTAWASLASFKTADESASEKPLFAELLLNGSWDRVHELATRDIGIRGMQFDALAALAELERRRGRYLLAQKHLVAALPDGFNTAPGNRYFYSTLWLLRTGAELELDSGDPERAVPWIDAHDRFLDWSGRVLDRSASQLLRARCHLVQGELDQALSLAVLALDLAERPRQPLALLHARRVLAQIRVMLEDLDTADEYLATAIDLAETCAAPYERALVLLTMAERYSVGGDRNRVSALLDTAREIATALGAVPLLDRITASSPQPLQPNRGNHSTFGLSTREIEVLRLVARGMTDTEVAEQLFISPRTVSGHLQSIYNKLGTSSRTAATAFAYEHDLV